MEEKILIKSIRSKKANTIFKIIIGISLILSLCFLLISFIELDTKRRARTQKEFYNEKTDRYEVFYIYERYNRKFDKYDEVEEIWGLTYYIYYNFEDCFADMKANGTLFRDTYAPSLFPFVPLLLHWSLILIAGITAFIWFILSKCELTITNTTAQGKTLFGKKVVIPIYMISAYSVQPIFSTIIITSSSGRTRFSLIGNLNEVCMVLSSLINERHDKTQNSSQPNTPQINSLDELTKLKDLLDKNIITQEEFDAKKKQLLGL